MSQFPNPNTEPIGIPKGMREPQRGQLLEYLAELSALRQSIADDLIIFLFGSMAEGVSHPWSDVDLALVTDYFSSVPWTKRIRKLGERLSPPPLLSPIGLTHEEYATYSHPAIIRFVREHHVRLL